MPNGGEHHCGYCAWFDASASVCQLRSLGIDEPFWTTCRNRCDHRPVDNQAIVGPLYAIVCEVRDGGGSYATIPYLADNRPDTVQPLRNGSYDTNLAVTGPDGERLCFGSVREYLDYCSARNAAYQEDQ